VRNALARLAREAARVLVLSVAEIVLDVESARALLVLLEARAKLATARHWRDWPETTRKFQEDGLE
jgi:hypothetical protein